MYKIVVTFEAERKSKITEQFRDIVRIDVSDARSELRMWDLTDVLTAEEHPCDREGWPENPQQCIDLSGLDKTTIQITRDDESFPR